MIQRKQTLYLILAVLLFAILFFAPFADLHVGTNQAGNVSLLSLLFFDSFKELRPFFSDFQYLFILMQILSTLFLSLIGVSIFMYKKRPLQIRLCAFAFITNILVIGSIFLAGNQIAKVEHLNLEIEYLLTAYIPLVTLLLIMLAQRAIRKDEAMVRSLNRLR